MSIPETPLRPPEDRPRHPIRVVAQRTGLTPATLRAWERRYGVVEPHRSAGGQRLYSDRDVERLTRLHRLSEGGRPISLVAGLSDEETEALLREDQASRFRGALAETGAGDGSEGAAAGMAAAAYERVAALDGEGLETLLRRAAVTLGAHPFLEEVVGPLLHRVGSAWAAGEIGTAEEHLCTVVTERILAWLTESSSPPPGSPRIVVATLPGERHGLGARLAAATAALEGWHVTHLGVDLPAGDIAGAARALAARAVALSLVTVPISETVQRDLAELARALPERTSLLLGGGAAAHLDHRTLPPMAEVVAGLGGLRRALAGLS